MENPVVVNKKLNTPEMDQESFRQLCSKTKEEQLSYFNTRFVKLLAKSGVEKNFKLYKMYKEKTDKNNGADLMVVSTEFSDILSSFNIKFSSMKARKTAFADLDLDKNQTVSMVELLVFVNRSLIVDSSNSRWADTPIGKVADDGEAYQAAVLKEIFLPPSGYDALLDKEIKTYVTTLREKSNTIAQLENEKKSVGGVKAVNIGQKIAKEQKALDDALRRFDIAVARAKTVLKNAAQDAQKLQKEVEAEDSSDKKKVNLTA